MIQDWFKHIKDRIEGKAEKGAKRSSKWRKVRKTHLETNPTCFICKSNKHIEVHHIIPFNIAPDKELDPENLITLCENKKYGINCHLLVGHLGNYRRVNPVVVIDATLWKMKLGK